MRTFRISLIVCGNLSAMFLTSTACTVVPNDHAVDVVRGFLSRANKLASGGVDGPVVTRNLVTHSAVVVQEVNLGRVFHVALQGSTRADGDLDDSQTRNLREVRSVVLHGSVLLVGTGHLSHNVEVQHSVGRSEGTSLSSTL